MRRYAVRLFLLTLGMPLLGCEPHQEAVAMQGNADTVVINYVGDISITLPVARKHCAQYERVPVLAETKPDYVVYACLRPGTAPPPRS
jgi:hypothetical protein